MLVTVTGPLQTSTPRSDIAIESHSSFLPSPELSALNPLTTTMSTLPTVHSSVKSERGRLPDPLIIEPMAPTGMLGSHPEVRAPPGLPPSTIDNRLSTIDTSSLLLSRPEIRIPEARLPTDITRLPDPRDILPSSPTFSFPGQSNLALLQDSRSMASHPLSATQNTYPLLSPNSLVHGTTASFPTSPTMGGLYSSLGCYAPTSQFNTPHQYVQTQEGRTLELLGGGNGSQASVVPMDTSMGLRLPLTPSTALTATTQASQQTVLTQDRKTIKQESMAQRQEHQQQGGQDFDVWRPY